jgi:transposase InsO family protein
VLIRRLRRDWRGPLVLVRPETVIGWHRRGWRLFWRWRSRGRGGRPKLDAEARELIATMARENPAWGSERIRGELLKLGIAVSKRSVQRYRGRGPARPPSQTWRTFLANYAAQIWAADLFTVQSLTFRTLYVLLFITHGRRELVHLNATAHPTAARVWRQLLEATPRGRQPRHRDAVCCGDFARRARRLGLATLLSPVRAPRANAVVERVIGTLGRECLDQLITLNERHPRATLAEFVRFYDAQRPHRTLHLATPVPAARLSEAPIRSRAVLGGLHQAYERAA